MARDLGRLKIRVATIAPGSTDTPMIALFKSKEASLVKHIPVGRFA